MADPPYTSHEYQVGTHQKNIADTQSGGQVWHKPPPPGGPTPLKGIIYAHEVRDLYQVQSCNTWPVFTDALVVHTPPIIAAEYQMGTHQAFNAEHPRCTVTTPFTSALVGRAPISGAFIAAPPEQIAAREAISASTSEIFGPQPPSAIPAISLFVAGAPQQADIPQGFAVVYQLPRPPPSTPFLKNVPFGSQEWPDSRPSSIETTYTPLFTRLPSPLLGPQVVGLEPYPETIQPNPSAVRGQTPATGAQVPLRSIPQAAPQQIDQGYGLVNDYGWSRFPPASISPDIPRAYYSIPQAAPQHADYLQSNESKISGQQPPTAIRPTINRTAWNDPDQKTIASQQSYGATFGNRKPPNFFINVKMVPGEDDPEQPSGSAGHGRIWQFVPETGDVFFTAYEYSVGNHHRNIADQHSRGWVVPRPPTTGSATPLGPVDFAAPQQSDEGRAWVFKQIPAGAQRPPLSAFVLGIPIERLDNESLITTEPVVAPPPAPPLGPTEFAGPQYHEQPAPIILSQQLGGAVSVALFTTVLGAPEQIDFGSGKTWGPQPTDAGKAYLSAEFHAAQDLPEQVSPALFSANLFQSPIIPTLLSAFPQVLEEQFDTGYGQVSQSALVATPPTAVPVVPAIFVPEAIPDLSNLGQASLSKPLLPLPTPALGPAIFAGMDTRDIAASDTSTKPRIIGQQPPTGAAPPLTIAFFSAPDQRNIADSVSGGSIRPVWVRNVPAFLTAPHFYPLGLSMPIRLGGIQMN